MSEHLSISPAGIVRAINETPSIAIQTIVVGYSADESGVRAFKAAQEIARLCQASLVLVRSISRTLGAVDAPYVDLAQDMLKFARTKLLREAQKAGLDSQIDFQLKVSFESPADLLLNVAQEAEADLMVVGCHGTHGIEALVSGSVSRSVGLHAICPVLVFPPESPIHLPEDGPVLFASDLECSGIKAAEYARAIAHLLSRPLIAIHTLPRPASTSPSERLWKEEHAREQLRILLGNSPTADAITYNVTYGTPSEEILAEAVDERAALIVLSGGVHASGVDHVPWETLSSILRSSPCPVLMVPTDSK